MEDSKFVFDYVHLLYYKWHKKSESWWITYSKKATINPINKKKQKILYIKNIKYEIYKIYAVTVALNQKRSAKYNNN